MTAVFAVFGAKMLLEVESVESVFACGRHKDDIAALTAVAAVGTAVGYVFFGMQACGTVAAIACLDVDFDLINKHINSCEG